MSVWLPWAQLWTKCSSQHSSEVAPLPGRCSCTPHHCWSPGSFNIYIVCPSVYLLSPDSRSLVVAPELVYCQPMPGRGVLWAEQVVDGGGWSVRGDSNLPTPSSLSLQREHTESSSELLHLHHRQLPLFLTIMNSSGGLIKWYNFYQGFKKYDVFLS